MSPTNSLLLDNEVQLLPSDDPSSVCQYSADRTHISVLSFDSRCFTDKNIEYIEELQPLVSQCSAVWIDVVGLADKGKIKELLKLLDVDMSVEELITGVKDRSVYKSFGQSIFISVEMLKQQREVDSSFLGILQVGNTLVTFRDYVIKSICVVRQDVRQTHSLLEGKGRLYLMQRLVETAVDSYQAILDMYSVELEALEDSVLENPQSKTMKDIHAIRKELLMLKRKLIPLKGEMRQFARDATYHASEIEQSVSQELFQHASNMLDTVEYFITVTSDVIALYMSSVSNRMNEVMTVLAIVAAIFLPPSLIASIYGMNFFNHTSPWNMPEVNWDFGYPFALVMMFGISAMFVIYFWRKGWLKVFSG